MADDSFVLAYKPPHGEKRLVPKHYLTNPALGFKSAPTGVVKEPVAAAESANTTIKEPAKRAGKGKEVEQ